MVASLHVSLPDGLRKFVDSRTNGTNAYSTPSEYVRALIREDMALQEERQFVHTELLKSKRDIEAGRIFTADQIKQETDEFLAQLDSQAGV